ncbi:hypothetical protein AB4144_59525, partial [Rhizobiaceae sp. 2RAB30]
MRFDRGPNAGAIADAEANALLAQQYAAAAEAARDEAIGAAAAVTTYETRTLAAASHPFSAPPFIRTCWFDADRAPGSGALYRRKAAPELDTPGDFTLTTL